MTGTTKFDAGGDLGAYEAVALHRLVRVFGPDGGRRIFERTLTCINRNTLRSADDLRAFSQVLSTRGGVEAAVGAMLGVDASLLEASTRRSAP